MDIRDFNEREISEINNYVLTQIPQSILPSLFIITEEPIKKSRAFIAIWRIMSSCADFIMEAETRRKLYEHLAYSKEAYDKLYPLIITYDATELELRKRRVFGEMVNTIINYNTQINYTVNTFLVFAERLEIISTETVAGINLEKDSGGELYEQLSKNVED